MIDTWSCKLMITKGDNNKQSGGLPHSEIHGSKLILSSPWLNAEYHVLHRLLLPRHSPNALIALDLIRKKTDLAARHGALLLAPRRFRSKACTSIPLDRPTMLWNVEHWLVVLDLDNVVV